MDKAGEQKTPHETEPEDELLTVRPSDQEGLNDRLINVDAVPVLVRYAWKHRCFKVCYFMTQLLKIRHSANVTILRVSRGIMFVVF